MEYQEIKQLKKEKQILVNVCFFNESGLVVNNRVPLKNVAMKIENKTVTLEELYKEHLALQENFKALSEKFEELMGKQTNFNKAVYEALKLNLQFVKESKEEQI